MISLPRFLDAAEWKGGTEGGRTYLMLGLAGKCSGPALPRSRRRIGTGVQPHTSSSWCDLGEWRAGSAGDVDNARLLFQNALAEESASKDPEMRAAFVRFEAQYGSVAEVAAAEAAWRAAVAGMAGAAGTPAPAAAAVQHMRQRYCFFDLWPCTLQQRRHLEAVAGAAGGARCASHHLAHVPCICLPGVAPPACPRQHLAR
jgi:Suppressor of forked protein (Suf)